MTVEPGSEGSGANGRVADDDEEMQRVRPDRRSVQRTALRPTDHRFDGGSGDLGEPYNDPAVGSALPSRIRIALEIMVLTKALGSRVGRPQQPRGCWAAGILDVLAALPIGWAVLTCGRAESALVRVVPNLDGVPCK
jgi:hypothetical protein